jgi:TIR domain
MAFQVFVSYSTRDLHVVTALREHLQSVGAIVYVAEYSTAPGQSLSEEIQGAIQRCDLFLLVWSTNARSSEWVPQEIGAAKGLKKPIMPVVLHAGLNLPAFLSDLKYLELHKNPTAAVEWLRGFVAERAQKKQQGEALALLAIVGAILIGLSAK